MLIAMPMPGNSQNDLSERIKGLIAERDGGNVGAAARRVGISQPSLHYIVRGQNWPSVESLTKIAAAYGVSADWLLGLSAERQGGSAGTEAERQRLAAWLRGLAHELDPRELPAAPPLPAGPEPSHTYTPLDPEANPATAGIKYLTPNAAQRAVAEDKHPTNRRPAIGGAKRRGK